MFVVVWPWMYMRSRTRSLGCADTDVAPASPRLIRPYCCAVNDGVTVTSRPTSRQPCAAPTVLIAGAVFGDWIFAMTPAFDGLTRVPIGGSDENLSLRTMIQPFAAVPDL